MNDGEPVATGCDPVDGLLGGGFERGTVTQVYGPPAAGKTNLALAAAIEVAAGGEPHPQFVVFVQGNGAVTDDVDGRDEMAGRLHTPTTGRRTE